MVMIEPTRPFDQKIVTLPCDSSIAWRNELSAMSPSTSARTKGGNG